MTVVSVGTEVDAPPERVWAVVSDPQNLPRWERHIAAVRDVPEGGLRTGSTYQTELEFMGAKARITASVEELDPPRYSKVRLTGVLDAVVETWVEPLDGDRSKLEHRIDFTFRGGPFGVLVAEAVNVLGAQVLLRRGVMAQKSQAEEG